MGNFKSAIILCSVHQFYSKKKSFSKKLQNYNVGKVKKFEHMVAIEKKMCNRERKKLWVPKTHPRTHRVKTSKPDLEPESKLQP